MRTHTNNFKTNIKNLGRQFNVRVVYGGTTLQNEQINNATLNYNGDILKSVMKVLKLDSNIDIPLNTQITFEFGLLVGNSYEYINYGTFIVDKSEKQENTNSYLLTCYDKMLYSMKPYEDLGVTYPITIRNYINALCTKLGLQFQNVSDNFVNYNKEIPNELYLDSDGKSLDYNFRDVLDELAQVTASTICINDSGKLEIRYITNTNDTIDEEFLKNVNVNFGEQYGAINTITFSRSADSDSISKSIPENLPDADKIEIKISDNQILNGNNRDEFIDGILNQLYGLSYYVNDFSSTGITYYDLCDRYNITVGENTYSCVMLNDEININNGLVENIFTNMPKTSKTDYSKVDKTDRKVNQTTLIVNKQEGRIDAVVSQVDEIEQELANPTSTKEGKYFDLEDALDEPLIDFSLYGETQQDSTTGKNIINFKTISYSANNNATVSRNGEEYTVVDTDSRWGSCRFSQSNLQLKTNTTYTFSALVKSTTSTTGSYLCVYGGENNTGDNIFSEKVMAGNRCYITFTTPSAFSSGTQQIGLLPTEVNKTAIFTDIMIEENSSMTNYEPYTNGASPNPNYPQPIHNVSGDNTIEICGKNLFNVNGTLKDGSIDKYNNGFKLTKNATYRTLNIYLPNPIPAGTYKITYNIINNTLSNINALQGAIYNSGGTSLGGIVFNNNEEISFTINEEAIRLYLYIQNSQANDVYITLDNFMISTNGGEYVPYQGNSQLISLGVENLFDGEIELGSISPNDGTTSSSTTRTRSKNYIKVKPNTTYYYTHEVGGNRWIVGYKSDKTGITDGNYSNYASALMMSDSSVLKFSFTTSATTEYIKWYDTNCTDLTEKITITIGSKEQHISTTPIELNKISTYQDYIYKESDRWFLHKEIGKVVLDGSPDEEWGIATNANFQAFALNGMINTNSLVGLCNYYKNFASSNWTYMKNNDFIVGRNNNQIIIRNDSISTETDFKNWLSTHNTIVYYVLATPTNTEITDTTLLEQLNRLMTLPLYKNMTHITLTPNDLQPTMKIEYYRDTSLNNTFVPKTEMDKYYTKTETIAQIQIGNSSIQQNVAEIQTTLDSNGEAINTISNQVQTLQSSTSLQINAINTQLENGVEKLTNSLVRIDANGINTSKTGETFNTQITNKSFEVKDSNKELVYLGYDNDIKKTVARMDWLESEHATIGTHRVETITKNGKKRTAWFYVGGGN